MTRPPQPSTGERVILCSRFDCAHSGDEWPRSMLPGSLLKVFQVPLCECEADIVITDRRAKFQKTCGAFAQKP